MLCPRLLGLRHRVDVVEGAYHEQGCDIPRHRQGCDLSLTALAGSRMLHVLMQMSRVVRRLSKDIYLAVDVAPSLSYSSHAMCAS